MGFDDNRDFKLEGAKSALPIWTEFMKRAHMHPGYHNVHDFEAPQGIVTADICTESGQLSTPMCPKVQNEVFISGTQPVETCRLHGAGRTQVAGWEPAQAVPATPTLESPPVVATANPQASRSDPRALRSIPVAPPPPAEADQQNNPKKKKGFLGRLKSIFK